MTGYSRSVIPGRPQTEEAASDLDKLIFGDAAQRPTVRPRGGDAPPVDLGDDEDNDPPPRLLREPVVKESAPDDRRKTRRRKSDYARLPDEARGYAAPQEDNRRGVVLLTGTVVVIGVFGAVVWNAYSGGVRSANAATSPVIAASGSFKSKPAGADAKPAPNEQASVFDRVETGARPASRPPPVEDQRDAVGDPATAAPPPVQMAAAPVVSAPKTEPASPPLPPPSTKTPAQAMAEPVAPQTAVAAAPVASVTPPPLKAVAMAPAPVETPLAGGFRPAFAPSGAHVVQIASLLSQDAAEAEWGRLVKSFPELFASANSSIVRADVKGETRYRLRVAAFASSADADAFCSALKAKGRDCYRTAR